MSSHGRSPYISIFSCTAGENRARSMLLTLFSDAKPTEPASSTPTCRSSPARYDNRLVFPSLAVIEQENGHVMVREAVLS